MQSTQRRIECSDSSLIEYLLSIIDDCKDFTDEKFKQTIESTCQYIISKRKNRNKIYENLIDLKNDINDELFLKQLAKDSIITNELKNIISAINSLGY